MNAAHELAAALVVAEVLGLSWRCLDPGGGQEQLADFELLDTNGPVGVLEVTSSMDRGSAMLRSAVRKRDWSFAGLRHCWVIWVVPSRIDLLHRHIEEALASLEAANGVLDYPRYRPDEPLPNVLSSLGIVSARSWALAEQMKDGKGLVVVHEHHAGGFYSAASANPAVMAELTKPDNQAKLAKSVGRAELFVWLEAGPAAAALALGHEPAFAGALTDLAFPVLRGAITGVWAAVAGGIG